MINGISQATMPNMIDNYPVTYEMVNEKHSVFKIELEEGKYVVVQAFKDLISVSFQGPTYNLFGGSKGMMGQFGTGKMLGRNGTTITDPDEFGNEWQGKTGCKCFCRGKVR